jgi:hypothetical protein
VVQQSREDVEGSYVYEHALYEPRYVCLLNRSEQSIKVYQRAIEQLRTRESQEYIYMN